MQVQTNQATMNEPVLAALPEETLLSVASYLSVQDIRSLASTCRAVRSTLVASQGAKTVLWTRRMAASFPSVFPRALDQAQVSLVDYYQLPAQGLSEPTSGEDVNLPLLTSLLPQRYPRSIDAGTLQYQVGNGRDASTRVEETRFFGPVVGVGDHCIRSGEPFPAMCRAISSKTTSKSIKKLISRVSTKSDRAAADLPPLPSRRAPLFQFLSSLTHTSGVGASDVRLKQRLGKLCPRTKPCNNFRPFVVPTVLYESRTIKGAKPRLIVDVTPRSVAYFEVNIAGRVENLSASSKIRGENKHHRIVAVGLSTQSFRTQENLPGWDDASYGYHGDDGRFFHRGRAAPQTDSSVTFGPGDTVGCGLEYHTRRIFFTLNGKFARYAFDKVKKDDIEKGLYPTVGVDSNYPICLNLGQRPFKFDVVDFAAV